jgi:hypothetical protein
LPNFLTLTGAPPARPQGGKKLARRAAFRRTDLSRFYSSSAFPPPQGKNHIQTPPFTTRQTPRSWVPRTLSNQTTKQLGPLQNRPDHIYENEPNRGASNTTSGKPITIPGTRHALLPGTQHQLLHGTPALLLFEPARLQ